MSDKAKGKKDKKGDKKKEENKENEEVKKEEGGEEAEVKVTNLGQLIYLQEKNYSEYVIYVQHLMIHLYM